MGTQKKHSQRSVKVNLVRSTFWTKMVLFRWQCWKRRKLCWLVRRRGQVRKWHHYLSEFIVCRLTSCSFSGCMPNLDVSCAVCANARPFLNNVDIPTASEDALLYIHFMNKSCRHGELSVVCEWVFAGFTWYISDSGRSSWGMALFMSCCSAWASGWGWQSLNCNSATSGFWLDHVYLSSNNVKLLSDINGTLQGVRAVERRKLEDEVNKLQVSSVLSRQPCWWCWNQK